MYTKLGKNKTNVTNTQDSDKNTSHVRQTD